MSHISQSFKGTPSLPPASERKPQSFKDILINSVQHKRKRINNVQCCLCLFCSPDCSNVRCTYKTHFVCSECACDWEVDKLCPVCKRSSIASSTKDRKFQSEIIFEEHRASDIRIQLAKEDKKSKSTQLESNLI